MPDAPLRLHPDRLLPTDPAVLSVARRIHQVTAHRPIVSPHGHVDPQILVDDQPFADPASLLITPDHYVTRLLHARGVPLEELGVGQGPLSEAAARRAWHHLCARWTVFAGTTVRTWLEAELVELFGIDRQPSAANADDLYDAVADRLTSPDLRPCALYRRFGLTVLATTDDPCSPLAAQEALAADPTWSGRVVPTFRPDRFLEAGDPAWTGALDELAHASGIDTGTSAGLVEALADRRRYFVAHGATSADHSHGDAGASPLSPVEAERLHALARTGSATPAEAVALRRHLVFEMARLSCEDGLVMTLHPGVARGHHGPTTARFGRDVGCDVPVSVEFTRALRPMLERFGTAAGFRVVLFTLDETTWSRELAPLAGFYPSVYLGAPWWFLDAPHAMRRFLHAVTETAGFSRLSGFVDDTRAFCSIPVRHDLARRVDAGVLAELVTLHRLGEDEATEIAVDLTVRATEVFRL